MVGFKWYRYFEVAWMTFQGYAVLLILAPVKYNLLFMINSYIACVLLSFIGSLQVQAMSSMTVLFFYVLISVMVASSDISWVIGAQGGLQFFRPQNSWDAWCPSYHPHVCDHHPNFCCLLIAAWGSLPFLLPLAMPLVTFVMLVN